MNKIFYHVTPFSRLSKIKTEGLSLRSETRGVYSDSLEEKRIYLFDSKETAEDAMVNWLCDKFSTVRYFALLQVELPDHVKVYSDPEIGGSYFVRDAIPGEFITFISKIDAGIE